MSGNIIQTYLTYLSKERGYSEHTVNAYKTDLNRFSNFLKSQASSNLEAKKEHIREFMADEFERGFHPKTVSRRLAAHVHQFLDQVRLHLQSSESGHPDESLVWQDLPEFH